MSTLLRETGLLDPQGPTLVVPPSFNAAASAAAWPAANRALFVRFDLLRAAFLRYLLWRVDTQAGNVQVGVSALSGAGYATQTKLLDSGVIACPAAGDQRTDLGGAQLPAGPYAAFLWSDSTTFQTRYAASSGIPGLRVAGNASPGASGVPASGAFAWGNQYVNMTVEAP